MTQRAWYLRRGVAWQPVLGCCAAAGVLAVALGRWPSTALVVLPALLACCAASAAFLFDEPATAVVDVTPRGTGWRRTTRVALTALPLLVWCGVVLLRPGDLPLSRPGWWLVGAAVIGLALGVSALASRHGVGRPGSGLAAGVVLAVIAPVVVVGFLDLDSPFPIEEFGDGVRTFWFGVAGVAAAVCVSALRPGLRR